MRGKIIRGKNIVERWDVVEGKNLLKERILEMKNLLETKNE